MRKALVVVALAIALSTNAASIDPSISRGLTTRRHMVFSATQRMIHLPDGSNALIWQPDLPDGRPPAMRVFIVAPSDDAEQDRSFSLELLIPDEIASGYPGQVRSVAMSANHKWLAAVGGWFGARDKHGHNGLFVMQWDERGGGHWRLKSWFDVPDLAIGDVAFGPDDLLVVTSRPHRPASSEVPIVTLFTIGGQNLGSFVPSPNHASALEMRIWRTGDNTYAVYDPETAQVRFLSLTKSAIVQQRTVPLPFSTNRVNVVAFDPRPDGRIVFARTIVENQRGKTILTVIKPDGGIEDEWIAPETWRFGYSDEQRVIRGFSNIPRNADMRMNVTAVTVR